MTGMAQVVDSLNNIATSYELILKTLLLIIYPKIGCKTMQKKPNTGKVQNLEPMLQLSY